MPNSTFVGPFDHVLKDLPKDMIRTVEPKNKQTMLKQAAEKRSIGKKAMRNSRHQ